MALKNQYFVYRAKNNTTGLTDVVAKVRRNGVYVLGTDVTPLALTEIDSGRYQLVLSPAQQTTAGGAGWYDVYIDSASRQAPAIAGREIEVNDLDDLDADLSALDGKVDVVDGKVDIIDANIDSIKTTVEGTNSEVTNPTTGLVNIKALVDAVQNTVNNISNVTRFSAPLPRPLVRLDTGTKRYKLPINFYDTAGNMEDPDSNQIQIQLTDEAGNVRDSYLVGFTAQPYYATRNSEGDYFYELDIPDTADLEQINFKFSLLENAVPLVNNNVTEIVAESSTAGLALETTSQDILTDTADMQPRISDIQAKINDAGFGLSALKDLIDIIDSVVDSNAAELGNATYGLSALRAQLDLKASQVSVTAITTNLDDNVKGAGFNNTTDSLTEISSRVFTGGTAI